MSKSPDVINAVIADWSSLTPSSCSKNVDAPAVKPFTVGVEKKLEYFYEHIIKHYNTYSFFFMFTDIESKALTICFPTL